MNTSQPDPGLILAINSGSSSLKLGFFALRDGDEQEVLQGSAENIGREDGSLRLETPDGNIVHHVDHICESQQDALRKLLAASQTHLKELPGTIGHRVVHGGPDLTQHQLITPALLAKLKAAQHFAPLHIPQSLALIETTHALFPDTPAVACFDTAFHRTLPEAARRFPLPSDLDRRGIRRYGFHGLSYESIVHSLGSRLPERAVAAHLGNGSSLCALRSGVSVDTTMGLTPTGGIPMATRSGDLDPGVLLFLLRAERMPSDALEDLLNHHSGMRAISDGEADMKTLLTRRRVGDEAATLAISIYTTAVRKTIGAYAALLGGLDMLIFAGGIGEHSEEIRRLICDGLEFLNLAPNSFGNRVLVVPSEEERQIARICRYLPT